MSCIMSRDPLRYLALGDSYTIGEGVPAAQRWPDQLAGLLRERGIAVAQPDVIARTGWTSGELLAGLADRQPSAGYRLASLLIGVNNQYRGKPIGAFESDLKNLIDEMTRLISRGVAGLFVLSIPNWGVTPYAEGRDVDRIRNEIDAFNAVVKTVTLHRGIRCFDITPISEEWAGREDGLTSDGLHPSGLQYAAWVSTFIKEIEQMLREGI